MEGSTVVTDSAPALEVPEITSVVETGPGLAEWTGNNGSSGGDGSEASSPWSLTEEQQVRNLKENWIRFLTCTKNVYRYLPPDLDVFDEESESHPWFTKVVAKLQVDPSLDSYEELEIDDKPFSTILASGGFRMTSLDVAILMGNLKMVQKILETSSDPKKLIQGSPVDEERVMRLSPDISPQKTNILFTPLHLAVASKDIYIIDALLEKGADINYKNLEHQTPLDYACKVRSVDMLQKLLEKDVFERDPLHIAVQNGDIDFIKQLPSQNVNAMDFWGKTPLHYLAVYPPHNFGVVRSIMQYLVEDQKLDMKALDYKGFSAFYRAILCCNT